MRVKRPLKLSDVNPAVSNDKTQGYSIGWQWVNLTTGGLYVCTSAATGAAVWIAAGGGGGVTTVNTRNGVVVLNATDIPAFVASGGSHAPGAVPDTPASAGTTKFLREDATWVAVAGTSYKRSLVDYLSLNTIAVPAITASSITICNLFVVEKEMSITGVRFYTSQTNKTVRCRIRNAAGTVLGTIDVTTTAVGAYTGTLPTPITIAAADVGKTYKVSVWTTDASGLTAITDTNIRANTERLAYPISDFQGIFYGQRVTVAGDANPVTNSTSNFPIEVLY